MVRTRLKRTTKKLANGTSVTTTKLVEAPVLEWVLQAAAVRALKAMPEYGETWAQRDDGTWPSFTVAADHNAGRRSPQEAVKAKATGIAAGEPDLRLYLNGGVLCSIEYKGERGRLSPEQVERHALLCGLGFTVAVVKAATEEECASATVALVRGWLAANDNAPADCVSGAHVSGGVGK